MDGNMEEAARKVRRAAEYRAAQNVDPDWWIKELIAREQLTGLAPEPFLLRNDDAGLDDRLRAETTEAAVRQILGDFNRRVINARRQLLGGPPVITQTRDVDVEVARWKESRRRNEPASVEEPRPEAPQGSGGRRRRGWLGRRGWQRPGR